MHIAYFVHGRGRGHATRTLPIVAQLRELGHVVEILGGGDARAIFEDDPSFRSIESVRLNLRGVITLFRQVLRFVRTLKGIDVVCTDGDLTGLLVARGLAVPVVAVGHGLVFSTTKLPPGLPRALVVRERRKARWARLLAHRLVAVHFLPTESAHPRTVVARPDERVLLPPLERRKHAVCYFRDENGDGYVDALLKRGIPVVLFSRRRFSPRAGLSVRAPSTEAFDEAFRSSSLVVASAGSNLLTESIYARKRLLAVSDAVDSEQRLNVLLGESEGAWVGTTFTDDPEEAVERLLGFHPSKDHGNALRAGLAPASAAVVEAVLGAVPEPLVLSKELEK